MGSLTTLKLHVGKLVAVQAVHKRIIQLSPACSGESA